MLQNGKWCSVIVHWRVVHIEFKGDKFDFSIHGGEKYEYNDKYIL